MLIGYCYDTTLHQILKWWWRPLSYVNLAIFSCCFNNTSSDLPTYLHVEDACLISHLFIQNVNFYWSTIFQRQYSVRSKASTAHKPCPFLAFWDRRGVSKQSFLNLLYSACFSFIPALPFFTPEGKFRLATEIWSEPTFPTSCYGCSVCLRHTPILA